MTKVVTMVLVAAMASLVACTGDKEDSADSAAVVNSGE
jgi:hypothetical protein